MKIVGVDGSMMVGWRHKEASFIEGLDMVEISFKGVFDVCSSKDGDEQVVLSSCGSTFIIRHMASHDKDAVCKVCLRTGNAGKDATEYFEDGTLLGKRWVLPYFEHSPDLSFVLVDEQSEVVGYALGCIDTVKFEEWMTQEYLPRMQKQYPLSSSPNPNNQFRDHEVIKDFHTFHGAPEFIAKLYPGHIHIDIFPEHQGKALGKPFLVSVFKAMRNANCNSMHLEMAESNHRALRFYSRLGLSKIMTHGDTLYLGMNFSSTQGLSSPEKNIVGISKDKFDRSSLAMLGTVLSVIPALRDWKEASIRQGEKFDTKFATLALSIANECIYDSIHNNDEASWMKSLTVKFEELLRICTQSNNFRPSIGSEHQLAACVEQALQFDNIAVDRNELLLLCILTVLMLQESMNIINVSQLSSNELCDKLFNAKTVNQVGKCVLAKAGKCFTNHIDIRIMLHALEGMKEFIQSKKFPCFPGYFHFESNCDRRLYVTVLKCAIQYLQNPSGFTPVIKSLPITELKNEFSDRLDGSLTAVDFVRILRNCDAQIFTGWGGYPNLFDNDLLQEYEKVASSMAQLLRKRKLTNSKTQNVFTGCGTSGRIAFLTARRCNFLLKDVLQGNHQPFGYCMAGGDAALLLSDEMPEDDPHLGAQHMKEVEEEDGKDGIYLIGISCGISAPYVAGQLDYFLDLNEQNVGNFNDHGAAVLGFNPVELSRNQPIEKFTCGRSFRDIARRLWETSLYNDRFGFLNPVIGPEPVSGSSRMKGGSVTAVLLDALCMRAIGLVDGLLPAEHPLHATSKRSIFDLLLNYQSAHTRTYETMISSLGSTMCDAADSLRDENGHVYYLGVDGAGIAGFIDSSEMPDTYGSPFDQIRGFVESGWTNMGNKEGDISSQSPLLKLSMKDFEEKVPSLTDKDTVVVLLAAEGSDRKVCISDELFFVASNAAVHGAKVSVIASIAYEDESAYKGVKSLIDTISVCRWKGNDGQTMNQYLIREVIADAHAHKLMPTDKISINHTVVRLPQAHDGMFSYSLKLMLNAISTYAQAKGRGALFTGLMVSAGPANDKIYMRCVDLIANTIKVSKKDAELCLIRAIYRDDDINEDALSTPRSVHIKASILPDDARDKAQISLPLALMIATKKWNINSAERALKDEPRVSQHLMTFINEQASQSNTTNYAIGIDVGGTSVRAAAVGSDFELKSEIVSAKISEYSVDRSFQDVVELIVKLYEQIVHDKMKGEIPMLVGIGQPGFVSADGGSVGGMANFDWGDKLHPIRDELLKRIKSQKIHLLNDANAALIAETRFYSNCPGTICMVTVGTGIGVSILIGGMKEVYPGSRGLVEGGHMIVDPNGPLCKCGQRGCLEMYCSGTAIGREGNRRDPSVCSAVDVVKKATQGDQVHQSVLNDACKYLAIGCLNLVRNFDPAVIILGGGLGELMCKDIKKWYNEVTWHLHDDVSQVRFETPQCESPGCTGAAMAAFQAYTNAE